MKLAVDVQCALADDSVPPPESLIKWSRAALAREAGVAEPGGVELTIRIVDAEEGRALNERWRKARGPTNVLSFPAQAACGLAPRLLGDVVICAPVVCREAGAQRKPLEAHWAHMVVHGVLHLLGYGHGDETEAGIMEGREAEILRSLGYRDPYAPA